MYVCVCFFLFFSFLLKHPDYEEEPPPEWLVDIPDPSTAEEWEMLSFYRFVDIDQPEAFANMLQVSRREAEEEKGWGHRGRGGGRGGVCRVIA